MIRRYVLSKESLNKLRELDPKYYNRIHMPKEQFHHLTSEYTDIEWGTKDDQDPGRNFAKHTYHDRKSNTTILLSVNVLGGETKNEREVGYLRIVGSKTGIEETISRINSLVKGAIK